MKGNQKVNLSWHRRCRRAIASVTLVAFLLQGTSVVWAQALTNLQITNDLDLNTSIQRVIEDAGSHQYEGIPYLTAASELNQVTEMSDLRERLLTNQPASLGEPTHLPLDVGGITTIIPVYPSYDHVGTDFVLNRYVREQVRDLLGRHLIDSDLVAFKSESHQLSTLYSNAYQFALDNPTIKYGDQLTAKGYSRVSAPENMVWPELRVINGEEVLVPVLYLTGATVADRKLDGHTVEFNGIAEFESITIENADIRLGRDGFLSAVNDLTCNSCTISSEDDDVTLFAGGTFSLLSGLITAQGDISIGAKNVEAETIIYRYDTATGHGTRYGEIAGFDSATGDINIRSYADISLGGVSLNAGGSIKLGADGNIYLGTQKLADSSTHKYGRAYSKRSSIDYLISRLTAEETIQIIANGNIKIDGSEILSSQGHIELLAGLGIFVGDQLKESQYKYSSKTTKINAYQAVAIRALLDAGKKIRLQSALGDITLRAADIRSGEGTSVTADSGGVNLLMTVETDHYSYSKVDKGLFTTKVTNRGHYIETGIPNTIVGGLAVEALNGVQVQYKGDRNLSLDQQISKLSQFEGLEWMGDVRANTPDADWQAIELQYEQWNESQTSLSPAFAAVVSIAVAIASGPAGANVAGAIMGSAATSAGLGTATAAAIAAGTQALLGQIVIAVANGAVDGDIGGAMESMASSETFKSLAISMVTAGALNALNTTFFSHIDVAKVDPGVLHDAQGHLSLLGQSTEAVARAATRASVSTLIKGESFGDFSGIFTNNLLNIGINSLGATMAHLIKGEWDNPGGWDQALRYIAHAGAGCVVGASQASIDKTTDTSNGCGGGALGAVTGEIVADTVRSQEDYQQSQEKLDAYFEEKNLSSLENLTPEQWLELRNLDIVEEGANLFELQRDGVNLARMSGAVAAFVSGSDAATIDIAAFAAENAAQNNGLFTTTVVIGLALLSAIDIAWTAHDFYEIYALYQSGEPGDRQKAEQLLDAFLVEKGIEIAASRILPGATSFAKLMDALSSRGAISPENADRFKRVVSGETAKIRSDDPVTPAPSGSISKGKSSNKTLELDGAAEPSTAAKFADAEAEFQQLQRSGTLTSEDKLRLDTVKRQTNEHLSELVLQRHGITSLGNSKVGNGSDNGADFVGSIVDEKGTELVYLTETKPFNDGVAKLGKLSDGNVQLSPVWVSNYLDKLERRGDAEALTMVQKIREARRDGNLRTAVTGLDRKTGDFRFITIDFDD